MFSGEVVMLQNQRFLELFTAMLLICNHYFGLERPLPTTALFQTVQQGSRMPRNVVISEEEISRIEKGGGLAAETVNDRERHFQCFEQ